MHLTESDPPPPEDPPEDLGSGQVPESVRAAVRRITEALLADGAPPPEDYVPSPALIQAVSEALRPAGLRERLRRRISGGMTVHQVLDRLPAEWRRTLGEGQDVPVLARRQAVYAIEHALYALCQQGRARRGRVSMAMDLPGKGLRSVQIDAYRPL